MTEESCVLMPDLLSFLKHDDPVVVRQSIITGTSLVCAVLTEMALQVLFVEQIPIKWINFFLLSV